MTRLRPSLSDNLSKIIFRLAAYLALVQSTVQILSISILKFFGRKLRTCRTLLGLKCAVFKLETRVGGAT